MKEDLFVFNDTIEGLSLPYLPPAATYAILHGAISIE